jgi:hypothetical protein
MMRRLVALEIAARLWHGRRGHAARYPSPSSGARSARNVFL